MSDKGKKIKVPDGMFIRCGVCKEISFKKEFLNSFRVCPSCGFHYRLMPSERIELLLDRGSLSQFDQGLTSIDPLSFKADKSYLESLSEARKKTGLEEAVIVGQAQIEGISVFFGLLDFGFIGGSMGSVVGEKVTRLFERATEKKRPVVWVIASGGARMQEGVFSLFQMAKTAQAVEEFSHSGQPYIAIFTHPTTGGVTASFASLADVIIAEPQALIGFAGPRVIEQTIRRRLPKGFQTAEFLLERGMVDMVVARVDLKRRLAQILKLLVGDGQTNI
jgi:acetyl-CoA carboxylase carboxyl transferase subunit beta